MPCRITLPVALAATLAFGALPAMAAMQSRETPADVRAFANARLSLDQAVKAVQDDTGGIVVGAAFHAAPEFGFKPTYAAAPLVGYREGYLVTYIASNSVSVCFVDPRTGEAAQTAAVATTNYNPEGLSQSDYDALWHAPDLPQAVALAEQRTGGRAIDAVAERRGGALGYRVGVVRDGRLSHEWVNPGAGQVASTN